MIKFIRFLFTVWGIGLLKNIMYDWEGESLPFKMVVLGFAIIFTALGYIPQNIYKYINKYICKKQEEQFLKEEERFLKENRSFNELMQEPSSQNQNHNNIQNSSYLAEDFNNILEKKSNDNIRDYSKDESLKEGIKSEI